MPAVLDSLVCFLSMFSHITTEYVIEKGEKASAQLSLVSLLGIVCKLGYILGKSWEEVMHVLCHLEFLGLFDRIDLFHHQCILLSDNERVDLTAMADGLVEEHFSNRTGLFFRLFSWSSEEDQTEQNIQMPPLIRNSGQILVKPYAISIILQSIPIQERRIRREMEMRVKDMMMMVMRVMKKRKR